MFGIFPAVEAKCQQPTEEANLASCRDPERHGLILTTKGREKLLMGMRVCDATKAPYLGDPLFNPELREYEFPLLVEYFRWLSLTITRCFCSQWWEAHGTAVGTVLCHSGGHIDLKKSEAQANPFNLRCFADVRIYFFLIIIVILSWLLITTFLNSLLAAMSLFAFFFLLNPSMFAIRTPLEKI